MELTWIYICGASIIISLVFLTIYSWKKSRSLRLLGYEYVYTYMKECGGLAYYREKKKHIDTRFEENYLSLVENRNKWYLFFGTKLIIEHLIDFYEKACNLTNGAAPFYSLNHYFAHSECMKFKPAVRDLEKSMETVVNEECRNYILKKYADAEFCKFPKEKRYQHGFLKMRDMHNKEFVEKELLENKTFFDTVLKYPLDPQQRESIVKLEDNCLVISSAGSGKTSTSIAKVKYLLDKRKLRKDEILVLSYNRKTAEEFQERLDVPGLACRTFHRFACDIIADVEGRFPDVAEDTFLLECYYQLIKKDETFEAAVTKYVGEVADLTKLEHEYEHAEKYFEDRETYGRMAPYGDMNGNPVFTRSEEEKKICTWLSTHNVDFRYEEPYPYDTSTKFHRQYKPDFTIYYELEGQRYYAYLEHFGIDKNSNVPQWFGEGKEGGFERANREYNEGIIWKRRVHNEFKTYLMETTSAMFHDKSIFEKLEQQLRKIGVNPVELSEEEKYKRLFERNETMEENIMKLFSSFIALMKSNGKSFDSIMQTIIESGQPENFCERCRFLMYEVIKPLYEEYEKALAEKKLRDFTDIILSAAKYCETGRYKSRFSYILVDEFQDISVDRYKFIVSLRQQDPLTKTYCVGDDWQSIYRFSGSDMNLFNHFEEHFGFTEKCKIETTYRFGNPLVERSSAFILKNPSQVQKTVKPLSDNVCTKISFVPFSRTSNETYLNEIKKLIESLPVDETVMLMARYNYEVKIFPRSCVRQQSPTSKRATVTFAGRTMQFMSVHAAKGLEADNVIILNCSQDGGGFPSRITDDPILGYVLSKIDTFEYSEERRLFYVAITRARKHTFVMYNENMPSVFVTEMTEKDDEHQLRCPVCKKGLFKVVKEDIAKNGKKYRFFLCSNSVAGCQNSWIAFYDDEQEIFPQYQNMLQRIERERQIELSKKQEQEKRWEEFERFVEENKKRKQQMQQRIDYANTLINMKKNI